INTFYYPDLSLMESRIKVLFKKNKIAGEWFYKKDIVLEFIQNLKRGEIPNVELLNKLKNKTIDISKIGNYENEEYTILKENAVNLLAKIKSERLGIGYPDSVDISTFMKNKKANYRNMLYLADDEFLFFERKPKFEIEVIKESQMIECLRIIKNSISNNNIKFKLQDYIDSIFAKSDIYFEKSINIIDSFFFQKDEKKALGFLLEEKITNQNVKINFNEENNLYSFENKFEELNQVEQIFLKKTTNSNLEIDVFGLISFDYKDRYCFCHFDVWNYLRVLNFFSIKKIDVNEIRMFYNNTLKYKEHYVFRFKYHLLNYEEKEFIKTLEIEDISFWYLCFNNDGVKYYCIYDDEYREQILEDLNIDFIEEY
ncbi:hypothetical protein PG615_10855, partial [Riemerella anatipestifer]|nr:hypothetical protein [Riemerella anatipestifer]